MIVERILDVCIDGATKTKIVYLSNLNSTTVNPYINLLVDNDLIEVAQRKRIIYKTTTKGLDFMKILKQHHQEISKLISVLANVGVVFCLANLWITNYLLKPS